MLIDIDPNFRTDPKDYSKVEIAKINSNNLRGNLFNEFRTEILKIYHGNLNKLQNPTESTWNTTEQILGVRKTGCT